MTRTPQRASALLAVLAVISLAPGAPPGHAAERAPEGLQATLEVLRPFTYAGDPLLVRVAVFNTTEKTYENTEGFDLIGGLQVATAAGTRLPHKGSKDQPDRQQQPAVIAPGGFFGMIRDVTTVIPDASKADTYTITWEARGLMAAPVTVKVIPRFDAKAKYVAVMETDYGYLEFDLLTKEAPGHVQNFYDLAHQGFYDNTMFHQIVKGVEIRGGDPLGTGAGWPGYTIEPEISGELTHKRGTLSMTRMPGQETDNGSQFVISLAPATKYDGTLTIFGQLIKGDDVLTALENIPTSGQFNRPFYRPIKPIPVRSVTIKKAGS